MNDSNTSLIEKEATAKMKETGRPFSRIEVVDIINSVIDKIDHTQQDAQLYKELKALSGYIADAKQEISDMQTVSSLEIDQEQISNATDELDAVVKATETATGTIMDSCERFEEIASKIEDAAIQETMFSEITSIYEACGFQDITGQRITKVVKTLKHIETQVDSILGTMESTFSEHGIHIEEETLENGPQLPENAISQDDIDALLASFD